MKRKIPFQHAHSHLSSRILRIFTGFALLTHLQAAPVATLWNVENGDWLTPTNWSNGLPGDLSPDTSQAVFNVTADSPAQSDVTLGSAATFDFLGVGFGKTVNLSLGDGAYLSGKSIQVGRFVSGATVQAAHWNIYGPATGQATIAWSSFLQIGGSPTGSGATVTFSGANLNILDSGSNVTVGRQGNGHTLTIQNGAKYSGKGAIVSGTTAISSGVGNNHKLIVTGAGSEMTLSGLSGSTSTLGLIVGSRPLTGSNSSNVQSGNTVEVSDGGKLSVIGDNPDATVSVLVGAATYRVNNSIQVTGANSLLEITGNVKTTIGLDNLSSYNNRLSVSDGGTIRMEGQLIIQNGASTAANRRNILDIGDGGTLLTSGTIISEGGLVRLHENGSLRGESLLGAPQAVTLSINRTGRFEATGSGLGQTVSVQIGDGTNEAVLAMGGAGRTSASTLVIDSAMTLNEHSALEVSIFGSNAMDAIQLGENSSFSLDDNVKLSILLSGYTLQLGDSYQLFTGESGHVVGSFASIVQPTLENGLSWDWSNFNEAGNWTFTVVPEPSSLWLLIGGLVVFGLHRAHKQRKASPGHMC